MIIKQGALHLHFALNLKNYVTNCGENRLCMCVCIGVYVLVCAHLCEYAYGCSARGCGLMMSDE